MDSIGVLLECLVNSSKSSPAHRVLARAGSRESTVEGSIEGFDTAEIVLALAGTNSGTNDRFFMEPMRQFFGMKREKFQEQ